MLQNGLKVPGECIGGADKKSKHTICFLLFPYNRIDISDFLLSEWGNFGDETIFWPLFFSIR